MPDNLKTQNMCDDAVGGGDPYSLQFIPDWFVTEEKIEIGSDEDDYCNYDGIIKWHDGYKKQKVQKASIKEGLLPIAWHPSRHWN